MFFDPLYLLFVLPGAVLSLIAQVWVKRAFHQYSRRSRPASTGAEAAQRS
jgi:Zn-dependent membrane protease YugP